MTKRRSMRLTTDAEETVKVSHSERSGSLTIETDSESVTLSPRQTDVLFNWVLRTKGKLDQDAIPEAA